MEEEPFNWELITEKVDYFIEFETKGTGYPSTGKKFTVPDGVTTVVLIDSVIAIAHWILLFDLIRDVEDYQDLGLMKHVRFTLPYVVEFEELKGKLG